MVFVSSQNVDQQPAKSLIERLRKGGFTVDHSPSNPAERDDPRWRGWYDSGLRASLDSADVFIVVVDEVWASSTWMGEESHQAMDAKGVRRVPKVFFWNPDSIEYMTKGMVGYLREELPNDLDELVRLVARTENA